MAKRTSLLIIMCNRYKSTKEQSIKRNNKSDNERRKLRSTDSKPLF